MPDPLTGLAARGGPEWTAGLGCWRGVRFRLDRASRSSRPESRQQSTSARTRLRGRQKGTPPLPMLPPSGRLCKTLDSPRRGGPGPVIVLQGEKGTANVLTSLDFWLANLNREASRLASSGSDQAGVDNQAVMYTRPHLGPGETPF